jgi:hypothetical protein
VRALRRVVSYLHGMVTEREKLTIEGYPGQLDRLWSLMRQVLVEQLAEMRQLVEQQQQWHRY